MTLPPRTTTRVLSPLMLFALLSLGISGGAAAVENRDWLMMVVTRSTDPTRETDFNAWYDDIDIPDVLEVPGYERARRGHRIDSSARLRIPTDEGPYVALYDIDTNAIDKTIIEMLMATRKMEARGRSTDLLQVTERVYYGRRAPERRGGATAGAEPRYLLVERTHGADTAPLNARFLSWYDGVHTLASRRSAAVVSMRRYELYRVLMIEPKAAPRYLTIYEVDAATDAEAIRVAAAIVNAPAVPPEFGGAAAFDASRLYRVLRDVKRAR